MLKRLLPEFLESLVKPIKKNLNQGKAQEEKNKESISNIASDFNLVEPSQRSILNSAKLSSRIYDLRALIIFISVVFGVVLFSNLFLSLVIKAQKKSQDSLIKKIETYAGVEERAKEIDRRTIEYKKILSQKQILSEKYKFVTDELGKDSSYSSISIDRLGFTVSIKVESPYAFTKLIQRLLDGGVVSEIVIESASLDITDKKFNVSIKGVFR